MAQPPTPGLAVVVQLPAVVDNGVKYTSDSPVPVAGRELSMTTPLAPLATLKDIRQPMRPGN